MYLDECTRCPRDERHRLGLCRTCDGQMLWSRSRHIYNCAAKKTLAIRPNEGRCGVGGVCRWTSRRCEFDGGCMVERRA